MHGETVPGGEAHLGDLVHEEAVVGQHVTDGLEVGELRLDRLDGRGGLRLGLGDAFWAPRGVGAAASEGGQQGPGAVVGVSDDADIGRQAAHLGRVDVDADQLQPRRAPAPAHVQQLEAGADGDGDVAFGPEFGSRGAGEAQRVALRNDPPAAPPGHGRRLKRFGQGSDGLRGVQRSAAHEDHRHAGAGERLGCVGDQVRVRLGRGEARQGVFNGSGGGLGEHLPGHLDRHRALPARHHLLEALGDKPLRLGRVLDPVGPLGDGAHHAQLVPHLMQGAPFAAQHVRVDLAGDAHHRCRRASGGEQRRSRIQEPRARHHRVDPRLAGCAGIAERHVGDPLLVARTDGLQPRLGLLEGVEQPIDLGSRQGEDGVHVVGEQALDDGFPSSEARVRHSGPFPSIQLGRCFRAPFTRVGAPIGA